MGSSLFHKMTQTAGNNDGEETGDARWIRLRTFRITAKSSFYNFRIPRNNT